MYGFRSAMTTTDSGTGNLTCAAVSGRRTLLDAVNNVTNTWVTYEIEHTNGTEWECGRAQIGSGNVLTNRSPEQSSNNNGLVAFSTGVKRVFLTPTPDSIRFAAQGQLPTTAGTSTAYTLAMSPKMNKLYDGMIVYGIANAACGDNPTMAVDSTGALSMVKGTNAVALKSGDFQTNDLLELMYDSTSGGRWRVLSALGDGAWLSVASAATVDLGAQPSLNILVTGTTTITSFGTTKSGASYAVRFAGALTLTHNATSLIIPGGGNITTAAGDIALVSSLGSGNWIVESYQPASGGCIGTKTNNNAAAGQVGEYVESVVAGVSYPTSTQYGDTTSISLPAGDWDVTLVASSYNNGATVTSVAHGISTTSGNSATGLTLGSNMVEIPPPNSSYKSPAAIPAYRISLASTTTVYAKMQASYSVATPNCAVRLSARRVR